MVRIDQEIVMSVHLRWIPIQRSTWSNETQGSAVFLAMTKTTKTH